MFRRILLLALLVPATGCSQTRSFLNMNSDSPSPFMGLEFSVDAGDVQGEETDDKAPKIKLCRTSNEAGAKHQPEAT